MTKAETVVQNALYELWYDYYTQPISTKERNELVQEFTDKWLDSTKIKVDKATYYHPMTRLKQRFDRPPVTAAEILADFIIRADMHEERNAEYPVTHDEQDLTLEDRRRTNELGLFSDELDDEAGERVPFGYVSEADAIAQSYEPKDPPTVEEFRAELARVKKYAEFYATSFEEDYGYNYDDALKRIKGLRLERVKECIVCGGAFYPRNVRREVCDQQHGIMSGGGRSKESACELLYNQSYHKQYYDDTKLRKSV